MTIRHSTAALAGAVCLVAMPATAQEEAEIGAPQIDLDDTIFGGDFLTIGAGAGLGPSYSGSDDYVINVLPLVLGSYGGVDVSPRAGGVTVDFVPDSDSGVSFDLGFAARIRRDRVNRIEDPVVELYGELDTAVEVGPAIGVNFDGVLNPFDTVSIGADALFDVAGAHQGYVISPGISYSTPLSRSVLANLSVSADWANEEFLDYYHAVVPLNTLVPDPDALPAFNPDGGGFRSVGANLLLGIDLDGNALNGGLGLVVIGGYSRLLGDAADSPFTDIRGSRNQFLGGLGLTYTFGL